MTRAALRDAIALDLATLLNAASWARSVLRLRSATATEGAPPDGGAAAPREDRGVALSLQDDEHSDGDRHNPEGGHVQASEDSQPDPRHHWTTEVDGDAEDVATLTDQEWAAALQRLFHHLALVPLAAGVGGAAAFSLVALLLQSTVFLYVALATAEVGAAVQIAQSIVADRWVNCLRASFSEARP